RHHHQPRHTLTVGSPARAAEQRDDGHMPDLRALLVSAMRKHSLGGAALAVVRAGDEPELVCEGLADHSARRAIDPGTVFRIASISKTMTAVALVQLRDRGLIGLDDPVNDHLRNLRIEVPPGAPPVT